MHTSAIELVVRLLSDTELTQFTSWPDWGQAASRLLRVDPRGLQGPGGRREARGLAEGCSQRLARAPDQQREGLDAKCFSATVRRGACKALGPREAEWSPGAAEPSSRLDQC